MKVVVNTTVFVLMLVATATMAIAQPPGGGRPGGGPPRGNDPGRAVLQALDVNGDKEISASEINNAPASLLELDTNGDGKLSKEDSETGQRGQRRARNARRPRGQEGPQGAGGPPEPEQMVKDAMAFDADRDGKLDEAELLQFVQQLGPPPGGPDQGGGRPQRPNR